MNKELNNLLEANSYNITDQAGNKLTVIDIEDAKKVMVEFAKEEIIEAFVEGYWGSMISGEKGVIKLARKYLKKRFDEC